MPPYQQPAQKAREHVDALSKAVDCTAQGTDTLS